MTKFHDLSFSRQPDGSIRLLQSDCGEDSIIDLHPAQLRYMAESFGLVAPDYPDDELSKRLARQLCTSQRELADECHRSHWLALTFAKLDGFCASLPDSVFPDDVWEDTTDSQEEPPADAQTNIAPMASMTQSKQPESNACQNGKQLGLAV